jgi:hypothetical protein
MVSVRQGEIRLLTTLKPDEPARREQHHHSCQAVAAHVMGQALLNS